MGTIPERPATPHLSLKLSKLGGNRLCPFVLSAWHLLPPFGLLRPQILSLAVSPPTGGRPRRDRAATAADWACGGVSGRAATGWKKYRRLIAAEFRSPIGHCGSSSGYCDCAAVGLALYCHRSSSPRLQRATAPSRCTDVVVSNVQTVHATQWTAYSRRVWNKR